MEYTELQVTSNFSFLRGASHPEELVEQAAALGYKAIAIADHNTLAGIVRAHVAAKTHGIRIIPACALQLLDGPSLLAYPTDREAYSRLSAMLTEGNLRAEKGSCFLYKADVYRYAEGMKFIVVPPPMLNADFEFEAEFNLSLQEYRSHLGSALYLGAICSYQAYDGKRLHRLARLSEQFDIPLAACNDVQYHDHERMELHHVVTCIREKCTIYNAGYRLQQNAERYLKPIKEMQRIFRQYPEALQHSVHIAEACHFSLNELEYVYPREICPAGRTPQEELVHLTWEGARQQFGDIPPAIRKTVEFELDFMEQKNYAAYFLTVYDLVRFARERGILCQGRGSAANSAVCYCLGITSVDPSKFKLLFARFMSDARNEPPDIDVDFEHERREEVIQYIYSKYGRDRAAIVATVTQLHFKGAVRDVAKVMGLSLDAINKLAASSWEFTSNWMEGKQVTGEGFDARDPHLVKVLQLTRQFIGFPRQLGQHTGGFVITEGKLSDLCPVLNARMENRTCIEWNKDDIDALGFLKVDVLALGMLTCIRKAFDLARDHYGLQLTLANIPQDDPAVYEMITHADTIGVFQIESRAQMSMLPRLKPRCFYDLVIEVAIVRPGPIQGDMVHPYLRRRNGLEAVEYPSQELKNILERTLGVPLFQEQAMEIAIVAAGFTPAEADQLRRSMATFRANGAMNGFGKKLVDGMVAKGYTPEFAARVFRQLQGFGSYGFPESHAASFALLVYISSWIKHYYPEIFASALLNSMPMGFYQPAQIVTDARRHGVVMKPVDINYSSWDNTLEEKAGKYFSVRLGFRQVKGLQQEAMQILEAARGNGYSTITSLVDAGIPQAMIEKLADADGFRSIGLDRRQALWEVAALADRPVVLYEGQSAALGCEREIALPVMSASEHVVQDYGSMSLSLKAHPLGFVRQQLSDQGVVTAAGLQQLADKTWLRVAGLVLVRQRPGTAAGIVFITLEDETGTLNLVVFKKIFEQYRGVILRARLLMVQGNLQREGEVVHVIVTHCYDMSGLLGSLTAPDAAASKLQTLSRADENGEHYNKKDSRVKKQKVVQGEIFHGGRNFR